VIGGSSISAGTTDEIQSCRWTGAEFHDRLCPVTKETQKALVIIFGMIAFGVALLVWANHVRPHGY
jgi:hypothetical protein